MLTPFLKWAGGKRWLLARKELKFPRYAGRFIEPFLGSGAIFFGHTPSSALLSDINVRLIDTYLAIKENPLAVYDHLKLHALAHSHDYYYQVRECWHSDRYVRASQFIYLNRSCWNGLYRENLRGNFNVPIGTKDKIILPTDDFKAISIALETAEIVNCDFSESIGTSGSGDFLFVDPPYTTAHNFNGFVKYNEKIFKWSDQVRLRNCLEDALTRGALVLVTNVDHHSVRELYAGWHQIRAISRPSVISGIAKGRRHVGELIISNFASDF